MIIKQNSANSIPKIIETLKKHEIVILKCDTIYGIVGKAPETFRKMCEIKGRTPNQAFLILIPSLDALKFHTEAELPSSLKTYWPGPLTLIFPGKTRDTSVALRMPDDPFLISVMKQGNLNLYSTSVNRHGESPLEKISDIIEEFSNKVDLIVDAGDLLEGKPSTILDIRFTPWKIIRQGALQLPGDLWQNNG